VIIFVPVRAGPKITISCMYLVKQSEGKKVNHERKLNKFELTWLEMSFVIKFVVSN
jgi:hypothetical protein